MDSEIIGISELPQVSVASAELSNLSEKIIVDDLLTEKVKLRMLTLHASNIYCMSSTKNDEGTLGVLSI